MSWNRITSRQNPTVKYVASLAEKKQRDRDGVFVAEGTTLLMDLCAAGILPDSVFLSDNAALPPERVEAVARGAGLYSVSSEVFAKMTTEKGSEGILSVFSRRHLPGLTSLEGKERLVALENVQDPGNVGTILRTAASLGIDGVLLCGCADPFGPKAIRASMGAVAHIPVAIFSDTDGMMDALDGAGIRTVAATLSPDAVEIGKTSLSSPVCVLLGNEGKGLTPLAVSRSREKCISPICGVESLNVAAASAIFLWEMVRKGEQGEG